MRQLLCTLIVAGFALGLTAPSIAADEKPKPKKGPEAMFKKKDTDGNGSLSKEEFLAGVPAERAEKAAARFAKADTDGNGSLSLEEFLAATPKKPAGDKKKPAKDDDNS